MTRRAASLAAAVALCLLLVSCETGDYRSGPVSAAPPTSSSSSTTSTSVLPQATTVGCPATPRRAAPDPARPRYTLSVDVHPTDGTVDGRLRVLFTPDQDTDRLVFRLWPNGPRTSAAGTKLDTGAVTVGGRPATSSLDDPTTLVVRTGATFKAGQQVDSSMTWTLTVTGAADDRVSRNGDAMRLGSFFPILPWEPGVGWDTDPAVGNFAEASTAPTADFDLTVTVPDGYGVLASGTPDPATPGHFTAGAMRDVALSVGRFATVSGVAMAPQPVQVTVGIQQGLAGSPAVYLDRVVKSLEDYGKRFGPYPWPTFTLAVTPGLDGGIEYPGHVMQGPNTLSVTSHEVGHQWFYGLVGNDQGRDPWLDEGLATWAEARFDGTLDTFKARSIPAVARNMVGQPMTFWSAHQDAYQDGVYTQGTQALAALGDPAMVDCALRVYVALNAYRIVRQPDLVRAAATVFPDAAATLGAYGVRT
ncbi:MAG TPA: M1 family aminopeptidase [Acidimicrobiales bacterium]|nr:M1 family aminopeptidase [Acidimicrobiales bacterium]